MHTQQNASVTQRARSPSFDPYNSAPFTEHFQSQVLTRADPRMLYYLFGQKEPHTNAKASFSPKRMSVGFTPCTERASERASARDR